MTDLETLGVRERIIETATGLFVAQGYDGVSMREIAAACNLSKAGLYYHFKDKEDLFLAILDENLTEFDALLGSIEAQAGSVRDKIVAYVRAIFTQLPQSHRAIIRLAAQDMAKINPTARAAFDQRYQDKFLSHLKRILEAGMASGHIRAFNPQLGVWALLGLMYPFLNQNLSESAEEIDRVVGLIEMVFFEGVEPRP